MDNNNVKLLNGMYASINPCVVADYLVQKKKIYDTWCKTSMRLFLRRYAPEAGNNLKKELDNAIDDLHFCIKWFPEHYNIGIDALMSVQRCRMYHRFWISNVYNLRRNINRPKKLMC